MINAIRRLLDWRGLAAVCILLAGCDPGSALRVRSRYPFAVTVSRAFVDSTGQHVSLRLSRVGAGGVARYRNGIPFRARSVDLVFTDDAGRVRKKLSTPFDTVQRQERNGTWDVAVGP